MPATLFAVPCGELLKRAGGTQVLDAILGAVFAVAAAVDLLGHSEWRAQWLTLDVAVAALTGAAVTLRRRQPLIAAGCLGGMLLLSAVQPNPATPMWGFITVLLVMFSTAAQLPLGRGVLTVVVVVAVAYPVQILSPGSLGEKLLSPLIIVGAPALAGVLVGTHRRQARHLALVTQQLRDERAQHLALAQLAERARIARDVHDVVAHSVSLMVVQAGAALSVLDEASPGRDAVVAVRATGRQALAELSRLLGVLRGRDGDRPLAQPGISELIELAKTAGAEVTAGGPFDEVPKGVALAAYQVGREALTNARRHAPGAPVHLVLACTAATLTVRVLDDGPTLATPAADGHGLTGMRERVALYGGTLQAGPVPGGGWAVCARLPLRRFGTEEMSTA